MSKKGENIYKRKDGRWEARYIKGYSQAGTICFGYCYGKTYREAKDKLTKVKAAMLTNTIHMPDYKRIRFAACCDEWLMLNQNRVKESTHVKYMTVIENHIKPRLGGCFVGDFSSMLIGQMPNELLTAEKLSAKTVRDILTILSSILAHIKK